MQFVVWPAYGVMLMLPWLGTYSISTMLPNKAIVAGTGILASTGLRLALRSALRNRRSTAALLGIAAVCAIAAGMIWDSVLAMLLGGSVGHGFERMGTLNAGVPQLAGGTYHALVLLTWSMSYLGVRSYYTQRALHAAIEDARPGGAVAAATLAPRRVVLRDGKRALVLDAEEIVRVEAAGDYVRVHLGTRRLLVRSTMAGLETTLPATEFVRIHRSSIVRLAQVRELIPKPNFEFHVVLRDGTKLTASRTYAARLRAALEIDPSARPGAG